VDGLKKDQEHRDRDGFLLRAANFFDLPDEILDGTPRVTVTGRRRVVVENHKGILEYGENTIVINGGGDYVRIRGDGLELVAMNAEELLIAGTILNVEFE